MLNDNLRFLTFLAPELWSVYEDLVGFIGERVGVEVELRVGKTYQEALHPANPFSLICGLPYVLLEQRTPESLEPLAAPVLQGMRYRGLPIYFSEVIVRRESPVEQFQDLRGKRWAFNEPESQSGYGIVRQRLIEMDERQGFFSGVFRSGYHRKSIQWVREGRVDGAAIDSQVMAVAQREDPTLLEDLRIVDSLGPSTIQPLVAQRSLPGALKAAVREAMLAATQETLGEVLERGLIERFTEVEPSDYDDIRDMLGVAEAKGFLQVR